MQHYKFNIPTCSSHAVQHIKHNSHRPACLSALIAQSLKTHPILNGMHASSHGPSLDHQGPELSREPQDQGAVWPEADPGGARQPPA
mmetsp:Transcript_22666/g.49677  ORF Transcript_22666/g.49677 Transcript_22666/m.49677 type:complete len:87 (-) Transcript_22666:392-652(-)